MASQMQIWREVHQTGRVHQNFQCWVHSGFLVQKEENICGTKLDIMIIHGCKSINMCEAIWLRKILIGMLSQMMDLFAIIRFVSNSIKT